MCDSLLSWLFTRASFHPLSKFVLVIAWPLGHTAMSIPKFGAPCSWHGALRCCLRFSSEPVEINSPTAQWKNQPLQFQAFSSWSCCLFPLWPAHLCQPQSTPWPGHSQGQVQWRLIVPQGLFSFVFLLLLVVVFIPCISFPWFVLSTGNSSPCVIVVSTTPSLVLNL